MDFKVCPEIEFVLFPSSERFSLASTICLTTECSSIWAGIQRWFPVKLPHCFPLQRGDNLWRVFGWSSQLRLLQLLEIWTWQLPGEKLETYCHSSLISFVCVCVQLVMIVIPVNFTPGQKQINHLQMTSSLSAATPESLCCIQPRLGSLQAGFPIPNPNKPNWSLKLISVPLLKSLIRPKTSEWEPRKHAENPHVQLNISSYYLCC